MLSWNDIEYLFARDARPAAFNAVVRILPVRVRETVVRRVFGVGRSAIVKAGRADSRFLFAPADREAMRVTYRDRFPDDAEACLGEADDIVAHRFDLLGSGPADLGPGIDWHCDFKSGYTWPRQFHTRIRPDRAPAGADIKVPWELSRFHHANVLGRAYWLTGDERFAREFVAQVLDWIAQNPIGVGVNWACPMDVSIRLVNWISGFTFFSASPTVDSRFRTRFLESLVAHQVFIFNNLEFSFRLEEDGYRKPVNGNHFASDVAGLLVASLVFPALRRKALYEAVLKHVWREGAVQVNPDGVHYELSIGYHRLVAEMLVLILLLCKRNGVEVPRGLETGVERMVEFTASVVGPDGRVPQYRDSDDGRFLAFNRRQSDDHRYLLNLGAVLFDRSDLKAAAPDLSAEAFWWLGVEGIQRFDDLKTGGRFRRSRCFADSGLCVMENDAGDSLLLSAAPVGMHGLSGHAHNDALAFDLRVAGRPVVVDPGTFVYTPDVAARNLFRSTAVHNTVCIDGTETAPLSDVALFELDDIACPTIERYRSDPRRDLLVARHEAYKRLPDAVIHRRIVCFDRARRRWRIRDRLRGCRRHDVAVAFHVAPGLHVELEQNARGATVSGPHGPMVRIVGDDRVDARFRCEPAWYSPRYGVREASTRLVFDAPRLLLPVKLDFLISVLTREDAA